MVDLRVHQTDVRHVGLEARLAHVAVQRCEQFLLVPADGRTQGPERSTPRGIGPCGATVEMGAQGVQGCAQVFHGTKERTPTPDRHTRRCRADQATLNPPATT
jgi:hypothetical protein